MKLGFRRRRKEELDQEIRSRLEMEGVERGENLSEAQGSASPESGNVELIKEVTCETWGRTAVEHLLRDVVYGLRMLRRSPGFTAVAVLTIGLGIGANTAIFSLINALMLRTLPVKDPEHLVLLKWGPPDWPGGVTLSGGQGTSFSYAAFEQIQSSKQVFASVFGFASLGSGKANINIESGGRASLATCEMVTRDYFTGLGVLPIVGRVIGAEDQSSAASPVAVVSYGYWARELGRNPAAVGQAIILNGIPFDIIGVAPPEFFGVEPGSAPDVWVPIIDRPELRPWAALPPGGESMLTGGHWWWIEIMGRLNPGVSEIQAQAAVQVAFEQSIVGLDATAKQDVLPRVELLPAGRGIEQLRRQFSKPLLLLMGMVGLVLLIACANVAGLLLARASARAKEISVRLALGAARARLIRQLLTESVLLAAIGGTAGLLFAYWGSNALVLLISSGRKPIILDVHPDARVLAFTAAVAVLTGILFGLAPAVQTTRVDLTPALKEAVVTRAGSTRRRMSGATVLVVSQIGLSFLLLVGASLFVRTFGKLETQDYGFNRNRLFMFGVDPMQAGYKGERFVVTYGELLERIKALDGVRVASICKFPLISGRASSGPIAIENYPLGSRQGMFAEWNAVGADYFQTMGIPQLLGRGIEQRDLLGSSHVAVINEAMARRFFKELDPIGWRFSMGIRFDPKTEFEIVGVVRSAKYSDARQAAPATFYIPYTTLKPAAVAGMYFEVRTAGDPKEVMPAIRAAVEGLVPGLPVFDLKTQNEQIDESLMQERLFARVSSFFGVLTALLAVIGLYGLLSYGVTQRTREIGTRMALGARSGDVVRLVIGQGVSLTLIGIGIGAAWALALTRLIRNLLFGVTAMDPVTFACVPILLMVIAIVACLIPAWRASRVDPMNALRYE